MTAVCSIRHEIDFAAVAGAGIAIVKAHLAGKLADAAIAGTVRYMGQIYASDVTGTAVIAVLLQIQTNRFGRRSTVGVTRITSIDTGALGTDGLCMFCCSGAGFVAFTAMRGIAG